MVEASKLATRPGLSYDDPRHGGTRGARERRGSPPASTAALVARARLGRVHARHVRDAAQRRNPAQLRLHRPAHRRVLVGRAEPLPRQLRGGEGGWSAQRSPRGGVSAHRSPRGGVSARGGPRGGSPRGWWSGTASGGVRLAAISPWPPTKVQNITQQ